MVITNSFKIATLAALMAVVSAVVPLDDYVSQPEAVYKWEHLEDKQMTSLFGNKIYVLNVTSLDWLDTSKQTGQGISVWSHLVYVAVPHDLKVTNMSMAYITGGDNDDPNKADNIFDQDIIMTDTIAHYSGGIGIAVKQIPNQPIIFPDDPKQQHRTEDAVIAYGWKKFMDDPEHDPRWLPRLPMVKASFQCMRAAQEFLQFNGIADVEGWLVAGASKRGWTTWDVGVTRCSTCVNIVGIAPLVPIVPDMETEIHRMW